MEKELNLSMKKDSFTAYEKARMIGSRALQLSQGAKPLVDLTPEEILEKKYNPIELAKLEFEAGKIPISIKRELPHETKSKPKPAN